MRHEAVRVPSRLLCHHRGAETLVLKPGVSSTGAGAAPGPRHGATGRRPHRRSGRAARHPTQEPRVLDLGAATLLPGFIDLHTHLTDKEDIHWEEVLLKTTPSQAALWGARNARITLEAGFTTCRDMGPTWPYVDVDLRDAVAQGSHPRPAHAGGGQLHLPDGGAGDARQFLFFVTCHGPQPGRRARRDHQGRAHELQARSRHIKDTGDRRDAVQGNPAEQQSYATRR